MLVDWHTLLAKIDSWLPRDHAPQIRRLAGEINGSIAAFIRGQGLVCLILAVFYALGLTWDPNNAGMAGEVSYPDGFAKLDPARIFHVHLRDWKKGPDGKVDWTFVGEGTFDNVGQIRSLLKTGYKETFTLETHAKHPDGKAAATRKSLTALLEVVKKV